MQTHNLTIIESAPDVADYNLIRAAIGWGALDPQQVAQALANSLFNVHAQVDGRTVGCARVVGDGAMFFYIQDMMILPEFQRQGIATRLMALLITFFERSAPNHSFIGLMAARGRAGFYEKHGIPLRPSDGPGMGSWKTEEWPGPTAANR